jgi:hypothetical protein
MSSSPPPSLSKPRPIELFATLFATLGLAASTLIALTVVSIGIARADRLTARSETTQFTVHMRG